MAEELTTAMHEEFVGDEISHFDLMIMNCFGAINRGIPKQKALKDSNLTDDEYDKNLERVLSQP